MKILLAIDDSPCSDAAVAEVARRPWPAQSEVRLITVDPPLDPGLLWSGPATVFDEFIQRQRAEAAERLRKATAALAHGAPALRVTPALLEGRPKDAILAEAERWGAELVVVGSHGYGPVLRFFLGSVALYVALHAPCSVEIVRRRPGPPESPPQDTHERDPGRASSVVP
ncbi:MAG: universal stress protein [Planctomycetia bacterium]|nr:universal stress protein [Planctomycetia bacterium]